MAMRDFLFSVTTIEPLQAAVASGHFAMADFLANEWAAQYTGEDLQDEVVQQDLAERRSLMESFLTCPKPPKGEPGSWSILLEEVAQQRGLMPQSNLPFNEGWKHTDCWQVYRKAVNGCITRSVRKLLQLLDDGRPLRGKQMDYDGCQFAWLTADEVKTLSNALSQVDQEVIAITDLVDFHETLVESLKIVSRQNRELVLGDC